MNKRIRLQPLLDITQKNILGYEALCNKGNALRYPSAEHILKCIVSACGNRPDFKLFINMTEKDAIDENFSRNFLDTVCQLGIDGSSIVLELSENTKPDTLPQVRNVLRELRANGIKIALDDFGTQYSTLELMRELPVDIVKIDKHFVQSAPSSKKWRALLRFFVDVSHDLGCMVVAEGIETVNQLDCVLESKADLGQGFLFSAPSSMRNHEQSSPFIQLNDFMTYLASRQINRVSSESV